MGKEQTSKPPPEDWLAHLRGLPPYPAHTGLTAGQLRSVIATYNPNKAAGPDGWRIAELQQWRGALLDWVAELLAEVEQQGAWLRELCRGETVLLPKGGTSDPLDRRPITLLPVLYRMWAALRATQFRAWLKECGVPPLVAGRNGTMRSAEHQGLLLALEIEEASAFSESLAGVAIDWSRC